MPLDIPHLRNPVATYKLGLREVRFADIGQSIYSMTVLSWPPVQYIFYSKCLISKIH